MKDIKYPEHSPPGAKAQKQIERAAVKNRSPLRSAPRRKKQGEAKTKSKAKMAQGQGNSTVIPQMEWRNPLDSIYHILAYFCNGLMKVARHYPNEAIGILLLLVAFLLFFKAAQDSSLIK